MAISEIYILESLLQSTEASPSPLLWSESDDNNSSPPGFTARVGPVRIALNDIHATSGTRLCLTLSLEEDRVFVQEPEPSGWWGRNYRCEEDQRMASAIRGLHGAVARQCQHREIRAVKEGDQIRQRIFNQLLFGEPGLLRES